MLSGNTCLGKGPGGESHFFYYPICEIIQKNTASVGTGLNDGERCVLPTLWLFSIGVSGWWMAFKQHFSSFRQPSALNGHKYWTHLTSFISAVALLKIGFRLACCWDMCLLINSAAYEATIPLRANTWQCQMNGWMNTVFHTHLDGRHKIQWIFFSWKSLEAIETKKKCKSKDIQWVTYELVERMQFLKQVLKEDSTKSLLWNPSWRQWLVPINKRHPF